MEKKIHAAAVSYQSGSAKHHTYLVGYPGASMAVRVSYPIKFDGWAGDKGRSRYELCDVMLTNSFPHPR